MLGAKLLNPKCTEDLQSPITLLAVPLEGAQDSYS